MEEYHTRMRKIATPVPVSYLSIFNSKYIQYSMQMYNIFSTMRSVCRACWLDLKP